MGTHSKDEFVIKAGQELEVTEEIYNFFNNAYGASGKFNFAVKGTPKKAAPTPSPKKAKVVVEAKAEDEPKEIKEK